MRVQDIMTRKVETITANENVRAALERMRTKRIRHLVVLRKGEVAGVVRTETFGRSIPSSSATSRRS